MCAPASHPPRKCGPGAPGAKEVHQVLACPGSALQLFAQKSAGEEIRP